MMKLPFVTCLIAAALSLAGCNAAQSGQSSGLLGLFSSSDSQPVERPAFTVFRRQALYNGHGIALSVLGNDIQAKDIERIATHERRSLVRVLVYTPEQSVAKDRPAAFWEHTETGGLRQIY